MIYAASFLNGRFQRTHVFASALGLQAFCNGASLIFELLGIHGDDFSLCTEESLRTGIGTTQLPPDEVEKAVAAIDEQAAQ